MTKDKRLRKELGGGKRFVCFNCKDKNKTFRLAKPLKSAPKLDDHIERERYRIETEDEDNDGDDYVMYLPSLLRILSHHSLKSSL